MTDSPRIQLLSIAILCVIGTFFATPQARTRSAGSKSSTSQSAQSAPKAVTSIAFSDVTASAGIEFHLTCGTAEKRYIMDSMCGGVAIFDYDNDGWMDLYFVNGSTLEDLRAGKGHTGKLYHNNHDGTFTDVSANSGLNQRGWGFGVAVGDYDNDGWEDLYITYLDGGILYHNNHDGTFADVTLQAGVANAGHWGTSASFGDYDNDGKLDLYVATYVDLDLNHLPEFGQGPFCTYRGIAVSCGPRGLKGARDRLFHNNGDGTFTDVTEQLNIDPGDYYGLGVMWLDYDLDGCEDIYVANDSTPSLLYHNNCHGGFDEVGTQAGVAYNADGKEQAGMGVDSADYDNDDWPDIVKINFSDDTNNLYRNDRGKEFTDMGGPSGFGPISTPFLGFGVKFLDIDNDGWPDIFIGNGHVNPQVDQHTFGVTYAERPLLFRNFGNGKFEEIGERVRSVIANAKPPFSRRYVARGVATGDLWNRGDVDIVMTVLDGSPLIFRNESRRGGQKGAANHWLGIKLVGTDSNRDGFGARVEIKAGGLRQAAEVRANSSFESASDPRLHFGLGTARQVDSTTVHWPSGKIDTLGPGAADREVVIREGSSPARPSSK